MTVHLSAKQDEKNAGKWLIVRSKERRQSSELPGMYADSKEAALAFMIHERANIVDHYEKNSSMTFMQFLMSTNEITNSEWGSKVVKKWAKRGVHIY